VYFAFIQFNFNLIFNSCYTLQRTATHNTTLLLFSFLFYLLHTHAATRCNTLQLNVKHCKHTVTHCNTLYHTEHTTTHCNTLQHTAAHCNTLQQTGTHCKTLPNTTTHCNTLKHISDTKFATHRNILEHTIHHTTITCQSVSSLSFSV